MRGRGLNSKGIWGTEVGKVKFDMGGQNNEGSKVMKRNIIKDSRELEVIFVTMKGGSRSSSKGKEVVLEKPYWEDHEFQKKKIIEVPNSS